MSNQNCKQPNCPGTLVDGICDECGMAAKGTSLLSTVSADNLPPGINLAPVTQNVTTSRTTSSRRLMTKALAYPTARTGTAKAAGTRRTSSRTTRGSTSRRNALGGGLISLPALPSLDPLTLVMKDPAIPAHRRVCPASPHKCFHKDEANLPVEQRRPVLVKLQKGFCGNCGTAYDYTPALKPGDVVSGKYKVTGPIAFGGMGWIYLAFDELLSRWVVLKGLLNAKDEESALAAIAERQYLAAVKHPKIVGIYDFVNHGAEGYIIMEYVGGRTLSSLRKERGPLPVEEAIAYIMGILPAFSYLHEQGYVYCDMKPENVMLEGDDVKLVDLGAMRKINDIDGAVYGTMGYMAPELVDKPDGTLAAANPVEVSDLYTLGRSLAQLIMDFSLRDHEFDLPTPAEQPVLAENESLYRFLLRATHPDMDERFQSAQDMQDQLFGILREIVALKTGPKPAESKVFTADNLLDATDEQGLMAPLARLLPSIKVDPNDKAASDLLRLAGIHNSERRVAAMVELAVQKSKSIEVRLRLAEAYILNGQIAEATPVLAAIEEKDPYDWRVSWLRGLAGLVAKDGKAASAEFETIYFEMPGEIAPKLAQAFAHEVAGDLERAAYYYDLVTKVDPNLVSASFGLSRCQAAQGELVNAAETLKQIPVSHSLRGAAQISMVKLLLNDATQLTIDLIDRAGAALDEVLPNGGIAFQLAGRLLSVAAPMKEWVAKGALVPPKLMGFKTDENSMRAGAESLFRVAAKTAKTEDEMIFWVDAANKVRPLTTV